MSPETWNCPECSTVNLAHELGCRVCGYDKPADAQTFTLPETDEPEPPRMSDPEYCRDLADRLMRVPVMYGVDQADVERLYEIASSLELVEQHISEDEPLESREILPGDF